MVDGAGRLWVIDCQDTRLGPPWYDLVSLLRDSYLDLPDRLEGECLALYRRGMAGSPAPGISDAAFADGYLRCAVQRHLKVLGTFARLAERGRMDYLAWVPRTLRHLKGALAPFPELSWIKRLLPAGGG
jgi:aminoglycoside/choline kinase family phosphotransferase